MNHKMFFLFALGLSAINVVGDRIEIPPEIREYKVNQYRVPLSDALNYPLLSGDSFRGISDWAVDHLVFQFEPENVKQGDVIFVGMAHLDFFIEKIAPKINVQFIMITSNASGTVDEKYLSFANNPKLLAWFGRNITLKHPKLVIIPLGLKWRGKGIKEYNTKMISYFNNNCHDRYFRRKNIHTVAAGFANTHRSREVLNNALRNKLGDLGFVSVQKKLKFKDYINELASARFVLSPRGANIDCYRTWEALYVGSIPVVESHGIDDVYEDLPVIIVKDLRQISKNFLDEQFCLLKTKSFNLKKLQIKYWYDLILTIKKSAQ
ncbi:MAG: hypothetical protein P0S94_02860 [Simkaniaceae bacterium]|nr:hypothetical protein [Simkaniaceae bacterium]